MVHSGFVPSTVLIAPPDHLPSLKARRDLPDVTAFADTEALRALDTITRTKPQVVALERTFAATSRGTALINRIKADPSLAACNIRIVSADDADTPEGDGEADAAVGAAQSDGKSEPAGGAAAPAPAAPLDQRGTRRAPRFQIVDGVEVMVDGNPATLVNLSIVGAQVVSPTIIKPNQRLRLSLPDAARVIRVAAGVAWAAFEMPKTGPRYRAGLEFVDADEGAVEKFIAEKKVGAEKPEKKGADKKSDEKKKKKD